MGSRVISPGDEKMHFGFSRKHFQTHRYYERKLIFIKCYMPECVLKAVCEFSCLILTASLELVLFPSHFMEEKLLLVRSGDVLKVTQIIADGVRL